MSNFTRSRFDQAEVTVLALIKYTHSARLSVTKHNKIIGLAGKVKRRFFRGHRLDAIASRADDPDGGRRSPQMSIWIRRGHRCLQGIMFAIDNLFLQFKRLLFDLADGPT